MKISMHAMSVDLLSNILGNLSWLLDKGEAFATAKKIEPSVLLSARLAPDMFPLTRQVQVACDIAKNSVSRLADQLRAAARAHRAHHRIPQGAAGQGLRKQRGA
jgi:uncharacterized protein